MEHVGTASTTSKKSFQGSNPEALLKTIVNKDQYNDL